MLTVSPVTITAGDCIPSLAVFSTISLSVPLTALYVPSNPPLITGHTSGDGKDGEKTLHADIRNS